MRTEEAPLSGQTIIYEDDEYYPFTHAYTDMPRINALPTITFDRYKLSISHYVKDRAGRRIPIYYLVRAPMKCHISKIVNYPFRKLGAPLILLVGNYGTGKSNLMNLLLSMYLAKGVQILMFTDRRFEVRHLAPTGFFDRNWRFHPHIIDVFIPNGYQFGNDGPFLWDERNNVNLYEFNSATEIIDSMKKHHLTVVYDEAFNRADKLKLWLDLMDIIARRADTKTHYMFAHHELAKLLPENATSDIYKLVQRAADTLMDFRKDRIGLITCYHIAGEVYYRVTQKFGYVLYKQPVNKKYFSPVERNARNFSLSDVNISQGGFWMTHHITKFPEMTKDYRLVPAEKTVNYPFQQKSRDEKKVLSRLADPTWLKVWTLHQEDVSVIQISKETGLKPAQIRYRIKVLEKELSNLRENIRHASCMTTD